MIAAFVECWEKRKAAVQVAFAAKHPDSYEDVVKAVVRLDRRLGKFGRWAGISGTDDPVLHRAINDMLTQLKRDRKWSVLALIVNRVMRPVDLYEALLRGDTLPTGDEGRHLETAVDHWLANADLAQGTKDDYRRVLTPLFSAHATLGDLPTKLRAVGQGLKLA